MKKPLPSSTLEAADIAQKRQAVEERIEQGYAPPSIEQQPQHPIITLEYTAKDLYATAYTKFRFGEMNEQALNKRYAEITQTLEKQGVLSHETDHDCNPMIMQAERIVDKAIEDVYSHAGKMSEAVTRTRYKWPFSKSTLEKQEPRTLTLYLNQSKDEAVKELEFRHLMRQDKYEIESEKLFEELKCYCRRYVDYRFGRVTEPDFAQDHSNALQNLEEIGLTGHVATQFLRMSEDIAESKIALHMGKTL